MRPSGADGSWSSEGVILFDGVTGDPIQRVSAAGGTPVVEVKPDPSRKETQVAWPAFLPDGKHFLYTASGQKPEDSMFRIGSLGSSESRPVAPAQTLITYAPPGYLLFVRDKTLVAQRFDLKSLKTSGEPAPIAEKIGTDSVGLARFSVSLNGVLAYRSGDSGTRLLWLDRGGKELETAGGIGDYWKSGALPTGRPAGLQRIGRAHRKARHLGSGPRSRRQLPIHVWRGRAQHRPAVVARRIADRLHVGNRRHLEPGREAGDRPGRGESPPEEQRGPRHRLRLVARREVPGLFASHEGGLGLPGAAGLRRRQADSDRPDTLQRVWPSFSPDGRFVAYQSNESGRAEIYVQTFPNASGKWQVSTAGGVDPSWRSDGKEIFYRAPDQKLMAVDVQAGETFQAGIPRSLFLARIPPGASRNRYVASADGQRFLFVAPLGRESMTPTTVVLNWFAELGKVTLSAGTRLGPYEILAPIGAGGMGEVYKARDTRLERDVAVKVLPPHLSTSEETRQRFEREAKTISQFSHPHICALHDVGREGDTDYLVMEYLEGETLADRLGKGPLPTEQILRYGIEIADALDKAHRQGIVHRDLKPGNVMLTKTGVKLLDFGLAKPLTAAGARPVSGASVMATEAQASAAADRARHDPRHVPVHGARAARGRRGRRPLRHLRLRLRALRDGDGQEGVHGQEPGVAHRLDPARRPAVDRRGRRR